MSSLFDDIIKRLNETDNSQAASVLEGLAAGAKAVGGIVSAMAEGVTDSVNKTKQDMHDSVLRSMKADKTGASHMIMAVKDVDGIKRVGFYDMDGHMKYTAVWSKSGRKYQITIADDTGYALGDLSAVRKFNGSAAYGIELYGRDYGEIRSSADQNHLIFDKWNLDIERARLGGLYKIYDSLHSELASITGKGLHKGFYAMTFDPGLDEIAMVLLASVAADFEK